jgi:hypothetical protein
MYVHVDRIVYCSFILDYCSALFICSAIAVHLLHSLVSFSTGGGTILGVALSRPLDDLSPHLFGIVLCPRSWADYSKFYHFQRNR